MYTFATLTTALFLYALMPLHAQDPAMPIAPDSSRVDSSMVVASSALADSADRARDSTHMAYAAMDEGTWVGIKGNVAHVGERSFVLKYADGSVGIALGSQELRDHTFNDGQAVTVYGRVDKDFYARKVIKALAVLLDGEHPTQHTVIGEEGRVRMLTASHVPGIVVHGRVTNIDGRKVTLERMDGAIIVDTGSLSYDPMQAQPHMRVELGDLVTAQGVVRGELWSVRLMKATALDVVKMGAEEQGADTTGTGSIGLDRSPMKSEEETP